MYVCMYVMETTNASSESGILEVITATQGNEDIRGSDNRDRLLVTHRVSECSTTERGNGVDFKPWHNAELNKRNAMHTHHYVSSSSLTNYSPTSWASLCHDPPLCTSSDQGGWGRLASLSLTNTHMHTHSVHAHTHIHICTHGAGHSKQSRESEKNLKELK